MFAELREKTSLMNQLLSEIPGTRVESVPVSPVQHLRIHPASEDRDQDQKRLEAVVNKAYQHDVAFTVARYLEKDEAFLPEPSIRVTINVALTEEEIRKAAAVLRKACQEVL
jgi:serine palmitoyltransferase